MGMLGPGSRFGNGLPSSNPQKTSASLPQAAPLSETAPVDVPAPRAPVSVDANDKAVTGTSPPLPTQAVFNLSPMQAARLLRQLLRFPEEMVDLLAFLSRLEGSEGKDAALLLQSFLEQQATLPREGLQAFLLGRLAQSEGKLLKLLQGASSAPGESLATLMRLLQSREELVTAARESPLEAVETLITLYMARNPLLEAQQFQLHFLGARFPSSLEQGEDAVDKEQDEADRRRRQQKEGDGRSGGEESSNQQRWLVTVATASLGEFRFTIVIERGLSGKIRALRLDVSYEIQASPLLDDIKQALEDALSVESFPSPELSFQLRKADEQVNLPIGHADVGSKPSVQVHSPENILVLELHWVYRIIRFIFDLDQSQVPNAGAVRAGSGAALTE